MTAVKCPSNSWLLQLHADRHSRPAPYIPGFSLLVRVSDRVTLELHSFDLLSDLLYTTSCTRRIEPVELERYESRARHGNTGRYRGRHVCCGVGDRHRDLVAYVRYCRDPVIRDRTRDGLSNCTARLTCPNLATRSAPV